MEELNGMRKERGGAMVLELVKSHRGRGRQCGAKEKKNGRRDFRGAVRTLKVRR